MATGRGDADLSLGRVFFADRPRYRRSLFAFMGTGGTATASLTVSGSGSGSYLGYASIVDNISGDPVYVPAALSAASNNPPPGDA